jgi:hypothetical protein
MTNKQFQKGINMKTYNISGSKRRCILYRATILLIFIALITVASTRLRADIETTGNCGGSVTIPFTDVAGSGFFCQIAAAYFTGLTSGTSATTFSPGDLVTREQMAAFITRTLDQSLERGSRRAALNQFSSPKTGSSLDYIQVGSVTNQAPEPGVAADGEDIWVSDIFASTVTRVHASDGKILGTWTGANFPSSICVAKGKVFITSASSPGKLYRIAPNAAPGAVTVGATDLGAQARGIAYDGERIWTADYSGSVSLVSINSPLPWPVSIKSDGFSHPAGILYDGNFMWVTDAGDDMLKRLDPIDATVSLVVPVGDNPQSPVFDGANIWVPNRDSNSITVVRAATGAVLATLTGNGLAQPVAVAFDGERILITNQGDSRVSLWKATSLAPLGSVTTSAEPYAACSDGLNFWITFDHGLLARF